MTTTVGVLGGGISGLSAAFHLSRRLASNQDIRIVLLEKTKRLGGWVKSDHVAIQAGHKTYSMALEAGPRTLRPKSLEMLELIHLLGLESSLSLVPYSHPAARNRFVYFPETGLTRLPSGVISLLRSQFVDRASLGGLLPAALAEPFRAANKPPGQTDESFDAFISRRFGTDFARRFGSSLVHGIYAADSRQLSMRATFGQVWDAEIAGGGSVVMGVLRGFGRAKSSASREEFQLGNMLNIMKGVSVFRFRDGIESIIRSLESAIQSDPRIEIRIEENIRSIRPSQQPGGVAVDTTSGPIEFSHLISTLPLPALSRTFPTTQPLPYLCYNPYTTVHVVNIVFPPSPTPIHPPGFGYLVPRPSAGYESSTDPILGCVFDSTVSSNTDPTVITVMLGGPFLISSEPIPMSKLLSTLAVHLGAESLPEPLAYRYHIQPNCIPTPLVGHLDRMAELQDVLQREWSGRLQVIGSGMGGVSLGDCVRDGRAAALNIVDRLRRASEN
ncbi:oxygen-dependent protoporphyrinogen oxidase [Ceratobasidium sp. 394]|nr:oxygen-dependent protoporphyrinogen oxidase [Ceratobasidium sp. 394]